MIKKRTSLVMSGILAIMLMLMLAACGESVPAAVQPASQVTSTAATTTAATTTTAPTSASSTVAATTAPASTGDGTATAIEGPMPPEVAQNNQTANEIEMVAPLRQTASLAPQQDASNSVPGFTYIVVSGDTLSGIAWYYGTTVLAIVKNNDIADPNVLYAGQRLFIPTTSGPSQQPTLYYIVQYKDTLSSIARRFGSSVDAIAQANNIADPNVLRVGQRLAIPGATNPGNTTLVYIIQRGDTLSGIAAYYGTTVAQLVKDNHLANSNLIYVGQRLVVRTA